MYHQPLGLPYKKKQILSWSYNLKKHEKEGEWSSLSVFSVSVSKRTSIIVPQWNERKGDALMCLRT